MNKSGAAADLCFLNELNGRKILVRGNHDYWWSSVTKLNEKYENICFLQNKATACEGYVVCGSRGWLCPGDKIFSGERDEKIYKRELLRLEMSLEDAKHIRGESPPDSPPRSDSAKSDKGQSNSPLIRDKKLIGLLHFPPTNEQREPSGFTDLFERYGATKVFYGHLHTKEGFGRSIEGVFGGVEYRLISLDYLSCKPIRV
jgi:predicted phosphohydrolase